MQRDLPVTVRLTRLDRLRDDVLLCSLQAVGTNVSGTDAAVAADGDDVAYHVTEAEFITCRPVTSTIDSAVPAFTAYNRLQSASNYFIGERCFFLTLFATLPLQGRLRIVLCPSVSSGLVTRERKVISYTVHFYLVFGFSKSTCTSHAF